MKHRHCWQMTSHVLLTLPDDQRMAERSTIWECPCGAWLNAHGTLPLGTPLGTPERWRQLLEQERRHATPESQMAQQQERIRFTHTRRWHP